MDAVNIVTSWANFTLVNVPGGALVVNDDWMMHVVRTFVFQVVVDAFGSAKTLTKFAYDHTTTTWVLFFLIRATW